jgi:hypothetical protein
MCLKNDLRVQGYGILPKCSQMLYQFKEDEGRKSRLVSTNVGLLCLKTVLKPLNGHKTPSFGGILDQILKR